MVRGRVKSILLGCTSAAVLLAATAAANAGGFALREQSAYGQGSSFAGIAAGGALSSMYWNPATITQFNGKTIEAGRHRHLPNASHTLHDGDARRFRQCRQQRQDAVVPASYSS